MDVNSVVSRTIKLALILTIILSGITIYTHAQTIKRMRIATTTSVENTGLLYKLTEKFTDKTGIIIDIIAVGTGKAIKLGENGDVDLILVHARTAEDKFVNEGYGINRKDVMYNDFIIIGPKNDPAELKKAKTIKKAFSKLNKANQTFLSRGDDSGTHKKEKWLWKNINIKPSGIWYKEAGRGMSETILMADNMNAYTLTDRGTYQFIKDKINLDICFEGGKDLLNHYGIIAVNPKLHNNTNIEAATGFINWIITKEAQTIIKNYKKDGHKLFTPMHIN